MANAAKVPGAPPVQATVTPDITAAVTDAPAIQAGAGAKLIDVRPATGGADTRCELPTASAGPDVTAAAAPRVTGRPIGGRATVRSRVQVRTPVPVVVPPRAPTVATPAKSNKGPRKETPGLVAITKSGHP